MTDQEPGRSIAIAAIAVAVVVLGVLAILVALR